MDELDRRIKALVAAAFEWGEMHAMMEMTDDHSSVESMMDARRAELELRDYINLVFRPRVPSHHLGEE